MAYLHKDYYQTQKKVLHCQLRVFDAFLTELMKKIHQIISYIRSF